ncbi:hypothetical protein KCA24_36310, partial [Escherichia coli]|nr:hypothetical protein [Escherichia coli]
GNFEGFFLGAPPLLSGWLFCHSAITLGACLLQVRVRVDAAHPYIPKWLSSHGIPCKMSGKTL